MLTRWTTIPLLDEEQISLLHEALGADEFKAIYSDFPTAACAGLASVEIAVLQGDLDQAKRAAHAMKGVASSFGAERLASIACCIELEAESIAGLVPLMTMLGDTIEATNGLLQTLTQQDAD